MSEAKHSFHATFRFLVDVGGQPQAAFTECTLPSIEWDMEEIREGGLNNYTHQLPGRRKGATVTLKNGVARAGLMEWYTQCMGEPPHTRRPISVTLYDSHQKAVATWNIDNAYPVKWSGPELRVGESTVAIETLQLACGEVTVDE